MKAIKITSSGQAALVHNAPKPELPSPEWICVKVVAVALNPVDWQHLQMMNVPVTLGSDFSGIVEEIGNAVAKPFRKGDRVFGFAHGSNSLRPNNGAFAEYVCVKGDLALKMPDNKSFEELAGSGVAVITVGQGLYQEMGLPWPTEPLKKKGPILIYGGSSGMGAVRIQFAKLSGFEVLTTSSPKNFDYVKSLGADHVFDSYDPEVGKKIRAFTNNKLFYAWDCIGNKGTPQQCADSLATYSPPDQSIFYGSIEEFEKMPREDVVHLYSIGFSSMGEEWESSYEKEPIKFPANREHYEWMKKWVSVAEKLLADAKWRPHRQEVRSGGFEGILQGLDDLMKGKVSGTKLTYRVGEPYIASCN